MCGICGYIGEEQPGLLRQMTDSLTHRGPDDSGFFEDRDIHLGHRRLSVIDIAGGAQPMQTDDGNFVVVYNGEIYNFREIRQDLEQRGYRFRTQSDTEVLLRLYQELGAEALQRLNGMFAFAIYDRRKRELFLARDRIGIKPLYYVETPGGILFASEIKALLHHPGWAPTVNPRAIHDYLTLRFVPGDTAVFNEVRRLPAGHHLLRRAEGRSELTRYWSPPVWDGAATRSDDDYLEELSELMEASVRRRMISDVSLGAYLSGGLDSSVIVALMSRIVNRPVKTFSVGFDYEHDELKDAAFTANHLGCEHREIACRPSDVELLPQIVYQMDEPQGDPITIPMYMLSREAKKEVTVILTGEGGDEIFGGYLFHKVMWGGDLYNRTVPRLLRKGLFEPLIAASPANLLNVAFQYPAHLGKRGKQKAIDYLSMLDPGQMESAYRHLISLFDARDVAGLYTPEFAQELASCVPRERNGWDMREPYLNRLLRLQFDYWLPDNMLLRQDKTGMAHGIEGRVPFLDHELVEFAMRLPVRLKLRHLTGKYVLRRYGEKILPKEVTQRKKMPFYVPIENYFQQPGFRAMMDDLLSERSVRKRGLFRPAKVAELRRNMDRREFLFVKQVFSLMVLELWFRVFVDRSMVFQQAS